MSVENKMIVRQTTLWTPMNFQHSFLNEGLTILTASWMLYSHKGLSFYCWVAKKLGHAFLFPDILDNIFLLSSQTAVKEEKLRLKMNASSWWSTRSTPQNFWMSSPRVHSKEKYVQRISLKLHEYKCSYQVYLLFLILRSINCWCRGLKTHTRHSNTAWSENWGVA